MKHSEAPIRLYKTPRGKLIIWEEDEDNYQLPHGPSSRTMDQPDPYWKLVRGFTTAESFWDFAKNSPLMREYVRKIRADHSLPEN